MGNYPWMNCTYTTKKKPLPTISAEEQAYKEAFAIR